MRFQGRVIRSGKFWHVEIPILDAATQGRSRAEAFKMTADLVETLADKKGFKVSVHPASGDMFELSSDDVRTMTALLLRRCRETSGLSLSEAAERLGAKSRNAYARYEQGRAVPTIDKLNELLRAVSPGRDFVLREAWAI
jgi:ribosome-binding protein aMBF1 (putative translation factor)